MDYSKIKWLILDVDGTMTDGGIYYDESGNELKKFCTKDAVGFFAAKAAGIKTVVLTGRQCQAVQRRMSELQVDFLYQGIKQKRIFLERFMQDQHIEKDCLGYIGDDLNDLSSMELARFIACPEDACDEVKQKATYISDKKGGQGAVRDSICHLLRKRGDWPIILQDLVK